MKTAETAAEKLPYGVCAAGLISLVIPSSVTSIGDRAFSNCSGLTSINIPDGVTSIGDGAFNICIGHTEAGTAEPFRIYTVDGREVSTWQKGINIVRTKSGRSFKVLR